MIRQRTLILAKEESTYGTDPTPTTSANAVEAFDVVLTPQSSMIDRNPMGITMSRPSMLNSKKKYQVKFSVEIRGSGSAGTAPKYGDLLESCGMSETIVGATSVTYKPASSSLKSCTIWIYKDGLLYEMNGCVGTVELDLEAGKTPMAKFTFDGLYVIPIDATFPTSATFDTTTPVVCEATSFTMGSYAAITDKLSLNINNTIATRESLNGTDGLAGFTITDRDPEGSFSPEAVLRATSNADFWAYFDAGTSKSLSIVLGSSAGNITTITAPVCVFKDVKPGDRSGVDVFEIPFQCAKSSGDDEISIALT